MQIEALEGQNLGNGYQIEPSLIEQPRYIPLQAIERILDGSFQFYNSQTDKFYPFADGYRQVTAYDTKYSLVRALIDDGRYRDLRFLVNAFVSPSNGVIPDVTSLQDDLRLRVREALLQRGDSREKREALGELSTFIKEVAEDRTLDAQRFKKLVGLFGSSRVVDILYRSRPEFRGIQVDQVKSILASYLGDFLITKGSFNPEDVEVGLEYLSDQNLQQGLLEVLKDSCLAFYNFSKRSAPQQDDHTIIDEYFEIVGLEIDGFGNADLTQVVGQAKDYYTSVLSRAKPRQVVDLLKEGREFPDLNQMINMQEIEDKKKVLIADEMGLGKSASSILSKETLGVKQAVVVTPSNVVSTWRAFLSDKVETDGKQVGYFRQGMAPNVLIVDNPKDLQDPNINSYDDIVISHERLNELYTPLLEKLDLGMLIVDEVHKLKNLLGGVRAANLLRLASKVEQDDSYLVLLSGTPVPNKIKDVAMILKLLYPDRFSKVDDQELVRKIIYGDLIDLRSLLIPRMQMKSLRESLEIPVLQENEIWFDLSEAEKEIYEVLMEEDEIDAKEKIRILRQFVMNPDLLNITPRVEGSKIRQVRDYLHRAFQEKNKVVMFVNGYIENVLRGERNIIDRLGLSEDVEVRIIMGGVSKEERERIQRDLRTSSGKMLVLVSGQTADVGVDFSASETADFYNEPWDKYDKSQQLHRIDREGLEHPLVSNTFIARNTIEEGIHRYIEVKYRAIEKLLRGVPITDLEKELLEKDEDQDESNLEVNPELAEYYFSSWDKMMKMFSYVKEIGEEDFIQFIAQYGKDYADCYTDLGSRSYQANACRVSGTIIDQLVRERGQAAEDVAILDIASGPQMLKRHIADGYQEGITSLDLNRFHFRDQEGRVVVGSFLNLPIASRSFDIVNLTLALHYVKFLPSRESYERLAVLAEMSRVLKVGGRAVLNLMYNLDIKDLEKFAIVANALGFRVVDQYCGQIRVGQNYRSRMITLEKLSDIEEDIDALIGKIGKENYDGLKFSKDSQGLRDTRRTIKEFEINGQVLPINFNNEDAKVLQEEESVITQGEELKRAYSSVEDIPAEEVISSGFVRVLIDKRYVLFKRLQKGSGVVVIK